MAFGWEKIALLMVFALVIFGPKRLPEIARQVGRFVGEIRRLSHEFEDEVREVAEPFHKEITEFSDPDEAQVRKAEAEAATTYDVDPNYSRFRVGREPPAEPPRPPAIP